MTIICKGGEWKTVKNPQEKDLGRPPPEDSLEINVLVTHRKYNWKHYGLFKPKLDIENKINQYM